MFRLNVEGRRERLIPQDVDKYSEHFELYFGATWNTLASRNSSNKMRLDDVDTRMEVDFEATLQGLHSRDWIDGCFNGLFVHHGPEAILAASEVIWDQRCNEDARLAGRQVDGRGCLHLLGTR